MYLSGSVVQVVVNSALKIVSSSITESWCGQKDKYKSNKKKKEGVVDMVLKGKAYINLKKRGQNFSLF